MPIVPDALMGGHGRLVELYIILACPAVPYQQFPLATILPGAP
jgi:hypothetical protein